MWCKKIIFSGNLQKFQSGGNHLCIPALVSRILLSGLWSDPEQRLWWWSLEGRSAMERSPWRLEHHSHGPREVRSADHRGVGHSSTSSFKIKSERCDSVCGRFDESANQGGGVWRGGEGVCTFLTQPMRMWGVEIFLNQPMKNVENESANETWF